LGEFDAGERVALGSVRGGASEFERIKAEWPLWCERMGLARVLPDRTVEVPRLLGWSSDGVMERWRVGVPGRFGDPGERSPKAMLPHFLVASRPGAVAGHGVETSPGVLEVVVSRWSLPEEFGFDPSSIPTDPQRVFLGVLMDGSPAVWDLAVEPHGLITGQTGSGKSEAAAMLLAQWFVKGWRVVVMTPKLLDPILTPYAAHHQVLTGITDDDLAACVEVWDQLRIDRTHRQKLQAEHGVRRWADMPAEVLAEYPLLAVVWDESRSFFMSHPGETQERKKLKASCLAAWNELVQEGRSAGHHGLIVTQSANVESLGGGFAAEQLGMVCAVRSLPRKWWPVVFPETTADVSLLANPVTKPGRAVARGLATPETLFGAVAVNDAPMQLPLMDDATRDGLLDGSIPWGPQPDPEPLDELTSSLEPSVPAEPVRPLVTAVVVVSVVWLVVLVAGLVVSL
jgi:hypothetical protein